MNISFFLQMKQELKIFQGLWPVGNCLILAAYNQQQAEEIAQETTIHTDNLVVNEMTINKPQVIEYLSGDY